MKPTGNPPTPLMEWVTAPLKERVRNLSGRGCPVTKKELSVSILWLSREPVDEESMKMLGCLRTPHETLSMAAESVVAIACSWILENSLARPDRDEAQTEIPLPI